MLLPLIVVCYIYICLFSIDIIKNATCHTFKHCQWQNKHFVFDWDFVCIYVCMCVYHYYFISVDVSRILFLLRDSLSCKYFFYAFGKRNHKNWCYIKWQSNDKIISEKSCINRKHTNKHFHNKLEFLKKIQKFLQKKN